MDDDDDLIELIHNTNGDANTVEAHEFERKHTGGTHTGGKLTENKRLIISSGDISDVDGFFALAEYC